MAKKKKKKEGITAYTKTALIGNERILYAAKLHFFSYVLPLILTLLGSFMLFAPELPDDLQDKGSKVFSFMDQIQFYIADRMKDIKALIPEAVKPFVDTVAQGRQYFLGLMFFGFGVGGLGRVFIKKNSLEFVVTTRKVIFKKGFVQRDATELSLDRIESVKVFQTAFDRMLNKGRVFVMGVGMEQINLKNIADPVKFHHEVLEAMSKFTHH